MNNFNLNTTLLFQRQRQYFIVRAFFLQGKAISRDMALYSASILQFKIELISIPTAKLCTYYFVISSLLTVRGPATP